MRPDQLDLFLDIAPAKPKLGRKRKQAAEVLAFPLARHVTVRAMADVMTKISKDDRDAFWRKHSKSLIWERIAAGIPPKAAHATVVEYTTAVRRLTRYLDADPARSGQRGGS